MVAQDWNGWNFRVADPDTGKAGMLALRYFPDGEPIHERDHLTASLPAGPSASRQGRRIETEEGTLDHGVPGVASR